MMTSENENNNTDGNTDYPTTTESASTAKTPSSSFSWMPRGRTLFVVVWLILLFIVSWGMSLGGLLGIKFWDPKYALKKIQEEPVEENLYNTTAFSENNASYYHTRKDAKPHRYQYFLPHVLGAFLWWNLYFFQLIPYVRHLYNKKLHRYLGRFLMVIALIQTVSGIGLACTSK